MVSIENIKKKIDNKTRITVEDALWLADNADITVLGTLSNLVNTLHNENRVYFNRNIHIEPTNICVNHCLFCSYRRRQGEPGSWFFSIPEMLEMAAKAVERDSRLSEIHIVGGVHPERGLSFYAELLLQMHNAFPGVHLKAFTAEEIVQMCKLENVSVDKGIAILKQNGLMSMPGGGAEIFEHIIRRKICPDKISGDEWLNVHEIAHRQGLYTNATMLYGHFDTMQHRIEHLNQLRQLQDKTQGFNAFIPLKFKAKNNKLEYLGEVSLIEDIKTYTISRIFLDNISHIKAYWPMLGIEKALLLLHFGVDDIDGTIADTTKIYSMAGGGDKPSLTPVEIVDLIKENKKIPVERDSLYNPIEIYD